jgi:16S rRNA C967 or C1407 C5-methylase (RsmB/RsmF family)
MGRKSKNASEAQVILKGKEGFETYYSQVWLDRWLGLKDLLLQDKVRLSLAVALRSTGFEVEQGVAEYQMDPASIAVALALGGVPEGDHLDLCAAPGGKSLAVILLAGGRGRFVLNELSENRRFRLLRVIKEHLPESWLKQIEVKGGAGERFGLKYKESFDRVMVDVPCSGERYQLKHPEQIAKWSKKSSSSLAVRQLSLLCSGFDCLKPGGRLVYATCSLSPLENDQVVKKLLKKRETAFCVQSSNPKSALDLVIESTEHGSQILPDLNAGAGPIYFSVIEKQK